MATRDYLTGKKPLLGQTNNGLVLLFAINAIIFIILNFLRIVYAFSYDPAAVAETEFQQQVLGWFNLPANLELLISRPWVMLSYMFSHYSIWNLISTLLWLWAFGYILQDLTGNNKLLPIYLYGGFAGAIVFLLSMNFIPYLHQNLANTAPMIGGGAAVMAIAVATTTLAPDYRLFPFINGGIPLWVLTLIFVAIDYATIATAGGGYALAHIAGAIIGFMYIFQLRKGKDMGAWMYGLVNWINDLFNPEKKHRKQTEKDKLFYKSSTEPFKKKANITQQRLDAILDKINQQGYHFLSEEEKTFLERASKEEEL